MAVLFSVRFSRPYTTSFTSFGSRLLSPMTRKRTLFFMKISSSSDATSSAISAVTSFGGRFQFSMEKV